MKKLYFLVALFLFSGICDAQWIASKFRIRFTDKNNSPYSLSNPLVYLSQKALDRRTNQGIALNATDLPINPWYIDSIRNTGVTILNPSKWFNSLTIFTTDSSKISKIKSFPFVAGIDSIGETPLKKGAKHMPKNFDSARDGVQSYEYPGANDNKYMTFEKEQSLPSVLSYDYGQAYTQVHMVATDYLHDLGFRGQGMTIAVLDVGFYHADSNSIFDSLWANNQILGTKDFVSPGGNVYSSGSHGAMVLSIMAGNRPGELIGTAPKANYWLLHTEDGGSEYPIEEDNWGSGAEFADSVGADVINSSLGYTQFDNPSWSHTYAQMNGHTARASQAAGMAARKGILVCNSAGNSGAGTWNYISSPADADSILAIGAVDGSSVYASFSSNGPSFDGRVKPNVCAMGQGTYFCNTSGVVGPGNGTSFSSPVMAGSVACLWQSCPHFNNIEIINVVQESADKYNNPDTCYGYGIPNMAAANLILSGHKPYNFDKENQLNVLPNPFTDKFSIIFMSSDTGVLSIELVNISGESVYKKENIRREHGYNYIPVKDLAGLSKGFYVLKVISGQKTFTTKLMKSE